MQKIALYLFIVFLCGRESSAQVMVDGELVGNVPKAKYSVEEGGAVGSISFYQNYISAFKNSTCPMYPSCSNYGLMVFSERPFLEAMALTADRMIRCSHDRQHYSPTLSYGHASLLDYPNCIDLPSQIKNEFKLQPHAPSLKHKSGRDSLELFINYLINAEKFREALYEIERAEFFGKRMSVRLYQAKLDCYEGLNDEIKGVYEYENDFPDSIKVEPQVAFTAARLYDILDNESRASQLIDMVVAHSDEQMLLAKAYSLRGIVEAKKNNKEEAMVAFDKAASYKGLGEYASINKETLNYMFDAKQKSPALASCLSIVPGLGYLYAGHPGSALTALFINSLLLYSTYTSVKSENYGVAALCGFFSLSFYLGNIKGAGKSAIRRNENIRKRGIEQLYRTNNPLIY